MSKYDKSKTKMLVNSLTKILMNIFGSMVFKVLIVFLTMIKDTIEDNDTDGAVDDIRQLQNELYDNNVRG